MIFIHMDMEWFSQKLSAPAFNSSTNEKIYKPVGFADNCLSENVGMGKGKR